MKEKRDNKTGRFLKGYTYRQPKSYWDKNWLYNEYIKKKKSAKSIAEEQGCKENNILYFLEKFGIKRRSISEIRKIKYWAMKGEKNPMFNKRGEKSPNWQGGKSPLRQKIYGRSEWKKLNKKILERDNYQCQLCGVEHKRGNQLVIHHWLPISSFPEFIDKEWNLITLCGTCHKKIHKAKIFRIDKPEDLVKLISEGKIK